MKLKKLYAKLTKPLVNPPQMEFVKLSPALLHNLNRFILQFPEVDLEWKFLWGRIIYKLSLEMNIFQILNENEVEWLCQPFCNLPHERYVQDFEIFQCLQTLLKGHVIHNIMGGYEMYRTNKKLYQNRDGVAAQPQEPQPQEPQPQEPQPQEPQPQEPQPQEPQLQEPQPREPLSHLPTIDNDATQSNDEDTGEDRSDEDTGEDWSDDGISEYQSDDDGISEYHSDDDDIVPRTNMLATDVDNNVVTHNRLSEIDDLILKSVLELSKKDVKGVGDMEGMEKNIMDYILDKSQKEIEDINSQMMKIQMNYIEDQTSATSTTTGISTSSYNDEIEDYCFYCDNNDDTSEHTESDIDDG